MPAEVTGAGVVVIVGPVGVVVGVVVVGHRWSGEALSARCRTAVTPCAEFDKGLAPTMIEPAPCRTRRTSPSGAPLPGPARWWAGAVAATMTV
ncbi:hypothetical protein ACFPM0_09940 [Pseudonocardia sulfidoxydans]|uniref:hypothetical protein n=1 Tax=Pseudonocardia sulfidoxydans TaxID=54011 RepID=UPI00362077DD